MANFTFSYSTAVAIRCRDGVIFAVEKLITSKLHESGTGQRVFTIDKHVGMVSLFINKLFFARNLVLALKVVSFLLK